MIKGIFTRLGFLVFSFVFIQINAQEKTTPQNQDIELGKVSWYRDYHEALHSSKKQNKAVLILFQEVPGCATCRNYGHNVLSNPLLVEAIENEFIPLAIHNNKGGADKKVLDIYNEPSWNNPVVRIVDQYGKDVVERISGNYSAKALYNAMVSVLKLENKPIPGYIKLLGEELSAANSGTIKEKTYKMYCFWSGEKHLGSAEGVLHTEAGFMGGHEVVRVKYDSKRISEEDLTQFASNADISPISSDRSYRPATKDEDYYLQHTPFKYLPLSPLQRTKINSAIGNRLDPMQYLSPSQLKWLEQLTKSNNKEKVLFNQSFAEAWEIKSSR
ncbi:VPGUxxT family thioredoxin-like (seleno)protein, type 2 [Spongiimicrobium salis]|uniref:VPGUxxT family thioredoxin-like (seleno)protein, type 2 n=1 Tax=Spongiimicrobium salis TaxID=1667022 RepID=UPI00374D6F64